MNFLLHWHCQFLNILRQIIRYLLDCWLSNGKVAENVGLTSWYHSLEVVSFHTIKPKRLAALGVHSVKVLQLLSVEILQVVTVNNSNYSTERGLKQTLVELSNTRFYLFDVLFFDQTLNLLFKVVFILVSFVRLLVDIYGLYLLALLVKFLYLRKKAVGLFKGVPL